MNWTQRRKRTARRRQLLRAVIVLTMLPAALGTGGLFLAGEQVVSGFATLERPPETIWRILLDLDGMPFWRSDLTAVERLPDQAGRPAWKEIGPRGERVLELAAAEPPSRLVLRGMQDGEPALPIRTYQLTAIPRGTRMTVTERRLIRNPVGRVLALLLPPRAGLDRFLRDLELRVSLGRREVAAGSP